MVRFVEQRTSGLRVKSRDLILIKNLRREIVVQFGLVAETEGFEPSVGLPPRFLSRELVSATHPRLRIAAASAAL